jgi:hypothetical protein
VQTLANAHVNTVLKDAVSRGATVRSGRLVQICGLIRSRRRARSERSSAV